MFWFIVTVMIMVALAIIILPILRKSPVKIDDRPQQNISIAQERLRQLKLERQAGRIDENSYESSRNELEQMLHDDLDGGGSKIGAAVHSSHKTEVALGVALPVLVVTLYFSLGSPDLIAKQTEAAPVSVKPLASTQSMASKQAKQVDSVQTMFERLKKKLEADPDNGQSWMMMGLTYTHFGRYSDAIEAYQRAVELLPDNQDARAALSRALTAQKAKSQKSVSEKIEKKIKGLDGQIVDVGAMVTRLRKRLEEERGDLSGWMMLGRSYMNLERYNDAVYAYQSALSIKADNPEAIQALQSALDAKKR